MNLFRHDTDNSDIDNVWVDVIPAMVTLIVRISVDGENNHYLEVGLLPASSMECSSPANELINWSHIIGAWDEDRELSVDIQGEYCYAQVDDYQVQVRNQLSEKVVVDVFKGGEILKELGVVTYDEIRVQDEPCVEENLQATLTNENAKQYFNNHGVVCPYCGSHKIDAQRPDTGDDMIWRKCYCLACENGWVEEYSLTRIFNDTNQSGIHRDHLDAPKGYETWWHNEGSGIRPLDGEDHEEHTNRVALKAWNACLAYIKQTNSVIG